MDRKRRVVWCQANGSAASAIGALNRNSDSLCWIIGGPLNRIARAWQVSEILRREQEPFWLTGGNGIALSSLGITPPERAQTGVLRALLQVKFENDLCGYVFNIKDGWHGNGSHPFDPAKGGAPPLPVPGLSQPVQGVEPVPSGLNLKGNKMANRNPIADQFSDEEMERINRFGQALGGVTPFDEEIEERLQMLERAREAGAAKMKTAQTGGSGLEPFEIKSKKPTDRTWVHYKQAQQILFVGHRTHDLKEQLLFGQAF